MTDTYVLVHGAWHTGAEFEAVAQAMRTSGCTVYCPTLAGNRPDDDREKIGLVDAIDSLARFIEDNELRDIRLVGHSYAGMVISGVADRLADRLARIVYVNAFVPLDGECLKDMVPPQHAALFDELTASSHGALMLPFNIWRECFINDADLPLARTSYSRLNPQPYRTFTDPISLNRPLAALAVGKSYVNCQQDTAMPHGHPWHPRLSERLGLFRLVECTGSHETLFSAPRRLAQAIIEAGRD